jgi:hypothetical protein
MADEAFQTGRHPLPARRYPHEIAPVVASVADEECLNRHDPKVAKGTAVTGRRGDGAGSGVNRQDAGTPRPDPSSLPLPRPDCQGGRSGRS